MTDYTETVGDLNTVTSTHPVLQQYADKISALELTIENQTKTIADYQQTVIGLRGKMYDEQVNHFAFKQTVTDLLIEGIDSGDISNELAEKWAKDLNIELTKEIVISGTISFSGKANVSIFADIDSYSLMSELSVDSLDISAFGFDLERFDYDLDDVEAEEV